METQPPSGMVAALDSRRHGNKLQGLPKPGGTAGRVELWVEETTRRKETKESLRVGMTSQDWVHIWKMDKTSPYLTPQILKLDVNWFSILQDHHKYSCLNSKNGAMYSPSDVVKITDDKYRIFNHVYCY